MSSLKLTILSYFILSLSKTILIFFIVIEKEIYKTEHHPLVAKTLANIGEQLLDLKKYDEALQKFKRALGKKVA